MKSYGLMIPWAGKGCSFLKSPVPVGTQVLEFARPPRSPPTVPLTPS